MCYTRSIKLDIYRTLSFAAPCCPGKEVSIITHAKAKPRPRNPHTPTQLCSLVKAAQQGEQAAIDRLCRDFEPLVRKEARCQKVYSALGEDALNTAWVIFLELIHKYRGNNYRQLPGFIAKHLHYGLLHSLHQEGCLLDCAALDAADKLIMDERDHFAASDARLMLQHALRKLSAKQRQVFQAIALDDTCVRTYSSSNSCSVQNTNKLLRLALRKMRKQLVDNKPKP